MLPVLYGSKALHLHGLNVSARDIDLLVTWDMLPSLPFSLFPVDSKTFKGTWHGEVVEVRVAREGSTDMELIKIQTQTIRHCPPGQSKLLNGLRVFALALDWLYTIKLSHRFRKSPHFWKTRSDIMSLRAQGCAVASRSFLTRRVKETLSRPVSLNQGKSDFFVTPGVTYTYDHDSLHRAVAIDSQPAYLAYMASGAPVMCSKEKWDLTPFPVKVNGVVEEALVLALERSQIPFDFAPDPDWSFRKAYEALCTTVTSGWFRRWAWEHWEDVEAKYQQLQLIRPYVGQFKTSLEAGVIDVYSN